MRRRIYIIIVLFVVSGLSFSVYNSWNSVLLTKHALYKHITNSYVFMDNDNDKRVKKTYNIINPETPDFPLLSLTALTASLIDGSNGRVLYSKNGEVKRAMASTTKIMTCIIALEKGNMDDIVTVSKYAASMPDVQLNMKSGDKYRLGDLLYSLMLESHNDTAVALAEHIAGSVEGFSTIMNEKASALGMNNTNFVTPNGLDADNHYSTAVDMCKLGRYAVKNKAFIKITNTKTYSFNEIKSGRSYTISNKNSFLNQYEDAIGIKTGFTGKAGYCFVGAVNKDKTLLISSVLAAGWPPNKSIKWSDTKEIMNYGINNYKSVDITYDKAIDFEIEVISGEKITVDYVIPMFENMKMLIAPWEKVELKMEYNKALAAPIAEGTSLGRVSYYINDQLYDSKDIVVSEGIERIDITYIIKQLSDIVF